MAKIDVAPLEEFGPGSAKIVTLGWTSIGVYNCNGKLYALEDRCSHDDGPLCEGEWDEDLCRVICPRHGSAFDLETGSPLSLPAYQPVETYPVVVEDGIVKVEVAIDRCWETTDELYNAYHDEEWGRPVRDERGLYERLCLEGFQSGLSWLTILRKREGFRAAFAGFDPDAGRARSASATSRGCWQTPRSSATAARSRRRSRMRGRRSLCARRSRCTSSSGRMRRSGTTCPRSPADWQASTPESAALSKRLKQAGFRFVGPTTVYAAMQACGVVNDHLAELLGPRGRRGRAIDVRPDRSGRFPANRGKEVVRRWRLQVRAVEVPARRGVSPGPDGESPSQRGGLA